MGFSFIPVRAGIHKPRTKKAAFTLAERAAIAAARLQYEPNENAAAIIAIAAPIYAKYGVPLPTPDYGVEKYADLKDAAGNPDTAKQAIRQATSLMQSVSVLSGDLLAIIEKLKSGSHPNTLLGIKMTNKAGKAKAYSEKELYAAGLEAGVWTVTDEAEEDLVAKDALAESSLEERLATCYTPEELGVPPEEPVFADLDDELGPEAMGLKVISSTQKK